MASNGSDRVGLLRAGGVLSIVAGISQIFSWVSLWVNVEVPSSLSYTLSELLFLPFLPDAWRPPFVSGLTLLIGWCAGVLGILAVVGGISAIRRKRFGLSLAGAISALPSVILGILAVIFVALGKREFGVERKGNGI